MVKGALTRTWPCELHVCVNRGSVLLRPLSTPWRPPRVLSKLAYVALCRSFQLLVLRAHGDAAKDLEILVLRHQLTVLRRQIGRPKLEPADRALLAAVSRVLPRARWSCFIIKPETLLRWHRRLVADAWTYPRRQTGRPPLDPEMQQLIIRLPERTRAGAISASKANSSALACTCRPLRSAPPCAATGSTRHHGERTAVGRHSCVSKPPGSSRATSSPLTRSGYAGCTCCSSSSWTPAGSTSLE
jgi:hypothetical protein